MMVQIVSVVLDVPTALNNCVKGNDDQPAPDAFIKCADPRQVVGIKDDKVAGTEAERVFVLLFRIDFIGRADLLDNRCIQPRAFIDLYSFLSIAFSNIFRVSISRNDYRVTL